MTEREALKLALEALEVANSCVDGYYIPKGKTHLPEVEQAITAIKEALAQPEQEPKCKYRRGDRLICLETEEYCVIHISGTDRQWIKFSDSFVGVYTNEQVAEMFEVLPKEPDQEQENMIFEMEWPKYHYQGMGCGLEDRGITDRYEAMQYGWDEALSHVAKILPEVIYTTPPQRTWVGLTPEEVDSLANLKVDGAYLSVPDTIRQTDAKLKEKNT